MKPCAIPCESRDELYARVMAQRDALEALLVRLERWEWPDAALLERVRDLLAYREP